MRNKIIRAVLLIFILTFALFGCGPEGEFSITVSGGKGEFLVGEAFSAGELVVTKIDADGVKNILGAGEYVVDFSDFDNQTPGTYNVKVSTADGAATYTYSVVVTKLNEILNVHYSGGAIFDTDDISDIVLSLSAGDTPGTVSLREGQTLSAGTKEYEWIFVPQTVGYTVVTGKITLTVLVSKPYAAELIIASPADKLTYNAFENFDPAGLTCQVEYSDGTRVPVTDFTIENGLSLSAGVGSIRILYGDLLAELHIVVNKIAAVYPNALPQTRNASYGQLLSEIALPQDIFWADGDDGVGEVGESTKNAYYLPGQSSENYIRQDFVINVIVVKADPDFERPENLTAEYGATLGSLEFADGRFSWSTPDMVLGQLGDIICSAIFTPADTDNYNIITGVSLTVTVVKATVTPAPPSALSIEYGKALNILNDTLPLGFAWENPQTVVENIGENIFLAQYTHLADAEHYQTVYGIEIAVNVERASSSILFSKPSFSGISYGQKLSALSFADQNFAWLNPDESVGNVTQDGAPSLRQAVYTPQDIIHYYPVTVDIAIYVTAIDSVLTAATQITGTIYTSFDLYASVLRKEINLVAVTAQTDNIGYFEYDQGQTLTAGTKEYNWTFYPETLNYKQLKGTISLTAVENEPDEI